MCTDINANACTATVATARRNGVTIEVIQDDLCNSMKSRLIGCVDLLMWNPPYVVTPSSEISGDGLSRSWAGGANGREVIDRFLTYATVRLTSFSHHTILSL